MNDEMHSLIGKYLSGHATEYEAAIVQQWIGETLENKAEFDLLEKLWNKIDEPQQISFDVESAWKQVNASITKPRTTGKTVRLSARLIAVAASVILLLGIWWVINENFADRSVYADSDVKEVRLEDGSQVYLRKGSTLKFPRKFENGRREVSLKGEAFFDVMPDRSKPFVISAAQTKVEVVGTSFSVNTNNNQVELIVKTGKVNFGASNATESSILVSAGERAMFAGNNIIKEANQDENFNAWQSRQLVFNNTPLPQVLNVLNNYYKVEIVFRKNDAAQLSGAALTARFNNQPLTSVLDEIAMITSYRIQKINDTQYEISIK